MTNKYSIEKILTENNFHKTKLHFTSSNHYKLIAKINGVKGWFILDTGASTTFVAKDLSKKYKLDYKETTIKAKGAGPEHIDANLSKNNRINLGKWQWKNCIIALIDLTPINTAFEAVNLAAVDGIIGADVLKNGSAVIDYDKNYLYMK